MPEKVVLERWVTMRDGVKLYTVILLPEGEGKYPLIIRRNPYCGEEDDNSDFAAQDSHGYAVLLQHCRGTGRSEGECNPYNNERNDGLDLLDWVRQQPFYNGELYLSGGSYCSSVHYSYLDTNPADVKAAFSGVQDSERYNILYRNGFYKTGLHGGWAFKMHKKNQQIERNFTVETFRTLPLAGITEKVFNERVPYLEEEFLHPDPADPYWLTPNGGRDYQNVCNKCDVPILFATGFYDIYTGGIFSIWQGLAEHRRKNCALVVTPFDHGYNPPAENIAEEYQDCRDGLLRECAPDLEYLWFDHARLGTPLEFIEKGKTVYYRMWDHCWVKCDELVNAPEEKTFYLGAGRTLSENKTGSGEVSYTYDPRNPAEFKGGVCNNFGGMKYQDPPDSRADIISFVSDPLEKDLICEGRIEVELHCRSTAEDTCFYVRLDFERNGKTRSLRDDIDSLCRVEKEYVPGSTRVLKYVFAPHAFKLLAGDRLRLDVSSSCVPFFQVHTNNKGLQAIQTDHKICRNTIVTGESKVQLFVKED